MTEKIGMNRCLLLPKPDLNLSALTIILKSRVFDKSRLATGGASEQQNTSEFSKCLNWSGWWDSHPRSLAPKASALDYWATPRLRPPERTLAGRGPAKRDGI